MTLTIGYKASAEQFGPRDLLDFGVLAEKVGLDSVWVSDHFQPWRHVGGHAPAAMPWMGALAASTERVQIGTSVLTPTFRNNPAMVAQAFATLDGLAPGRIALGVGSGEALNEVAVLGDFEWPEFKERYARLREAVRLIRTLWSEERVTFDGEYYKTVDATVYDRPAQQIPIYIAAGGPQVAKYAGRAGDGFICTSGKGMELYTDKLLPALAEGRELSGRPGQPDKMIEIKLSYAHSREEALENCRFWAPLSLTPEQKHSLQDPAAMAAAADALPIEQVAKRWIVATSVEEVLAEVTPYVDAGLNHLVFHAPGHDQERFLRDFGSEVVPALRALQA
ncbi:glucose-6-phosphate dehydrogenase (coenzyme-F420) [Nocardioides sp.]|uniref:glucose-6-phosphate dehydrogenase (coenzyme-F420) n=1 Tax=Nocardioides sp. TaxID=35761 RepID=UPI00260E5694|nr:glucose-6-phosphate dehydrogenase (coenzyme-F420) [Nocardioides sp.]